MTEDVVPRAQSHRWYSRPVLFVADLGRALRFYVDQLGFGKDWHADDGLGTVCQVSAATARSSSARTLCATTRRASSSS